MSDPIIIDTPEGIAHFQFARCIAALKIEVGTGMKVYRDSILNYVRDTYGVKSRTKQGALNEMLALYKQTYGLDYGKK